MNKYETITNIKERRIAFLNDTVAHYRLGNRSVMAGTDKCLYLAEDESSEGCAIGRHLPKELAQRMDEKEFGTLSGLYNNHALFNALPDWMKEMGHCFLTRVQSLHDIESYWTSEGISEMGVYELNRIKEQFSLI